MFYVAYLNDNKNEYDAWNEKVRLSFLEYKMNNIGFFLFFLKGNEFPFFYFLNAIPVKDWSINLEKQ
jgi:hypothetical protein